MLSNFKNKKNKEPQREEKQFIVFNINDKSFGVDVKQIKQIIPSEESIPIPNSPEFIEGVINLRGEIIPIVDMKRKLKFDISNNEKNDEKIIIVELDKNNVGMRVDSVSEMTRLYTDEISEAPNIVKGINKDYLMGLGKFKNSLLILLDLGRILSDEEVSILDNIDI
ncbi:chemotaxis protein CheW [Natronospora cellulosivora (SeqCode)]